MYEYFGRSINCFCKDCEHYQIYSCRDEHYFNCEVYGETMIEEADWSGTYCGCGLAPNVPYDGPDIVEMKNREKPNTSEVIGEQMSMLE